MNLGEKIKRINELYHKSQEEGLTQEEKEEQARLRAEYVANVRANLRGQLDNVDIREAEASQSLVRNGRKADQSLPFYDVAGLENGNKSGNQKTYLGSPKRTDR